MFFSLLKHDYLLLFCLLFEIFYAKRLGLFLNFKSKINVAVSVYYKKFLLFYLDRIKGRYELDDSSTCLYI